MKDRPISPAKRTTPSGALLVCCLGLIATTGCSSLSTLDRTASSYVPIGHVTPPVTTPAPMTLPRYLGIDVVVRRTVLFGHLVREKVAAVVPALEPKPLSLPLSHPANSESPSPAVAGAHKAKQAKAAEAAKIKAVAVLAGEDCASNPHVEEGLLAALDDVSAEVRIAAIEAVLRSRRGCGLQCNGCSSGCCSPSIRAKLTTMVFEQTGPNCWLEPSSKARRLARLALDACGGPLHVEPGPAESEVPIELPPPEIVSEVLGQR
ncbi:MAG: hypothetical protein MI861_25090 [Pirellulales bacterium]|nr:hypothetical protein [Pirellulales bacterium]